MDLFVYCQEFLLQEECHFPFLFSTSVVTIGFNGTYSVREDVGGVSIVVFALMNTLARDVEVTLSTLDDTARGRFCTLSELNKIDSDYLPIFSCMQLGWTTLTYLEA